MNNGVWICLIMAGLFFPLALMFMLMGEKGVMLISGFNALPDEQRQQYDQQKMSKDMRDTLFAWGFVFAAGGLLSYVLSAWASVFSFLVWINLFIKEVPWKPEKAFDKYRF